MRVFYQPKAVEQLASLDQRLRARILRTVDFFATQPDPLKFAKPLTGYNAYRFRIGEYRVIFQVKDRIEVLLVVKREGAYRNL
jgi:mRNA interferase RelE/StbE